MTKFEKGERVLLMPEKQIAFVDTYLELGDKYRVLLPNRTTEIRHKDKVEKVPPSSVSLVKGDLIASKREHGKRKVLAALQDNYFLSEVDDFLRGDEWYTQQDLFKKRFIWVGYDDDLPLDVATSKS